MTTQHTPGPWELRQEVERNGGRWFLDHEQGGESYSHVIFADVSAQDAALMASAPELLAALQDCVEDLQNWAGDHGCDATEAALEKARAAIARATEG